MDTIPRDQAEAAAAAAAEVDADVEVEAQGRGRQGFGHDPVGPSFSMPTSGPGDQEMLFDFEALGTPAKSPSPSGPR